LGEGRELAVAKNRLMGQLRSLQGWQISYWYDIGNEGDDSAGLGSAMGGRCLGRSRAITRARPYPAASPSGGVWPYRERACQGELFPNEIRANTAPEEQ